MSFSNSELADFKSAHVDNFNAVCTINRNTITTDAYGDVIATPGTTAGVSCGFSLTGGIKTIKGKTIVVEYDATIRLPVTTPAIGLNDTITITSHLGNVTNDTFSVYSIPEIGTVMTIKLKKIGL